MWFTLVRRRSAGSFPEQRLAIEPLVIATVFSIGWYKLETSRKAKVHVNTEIILVTRGIFRGFPFESVALLNQK